MSSFIRMGETVDNQRRAKRKADDVREKSDCKAYACEVVDDGSYKTLAN